jgi:KUP system potassium uptake protein
LTWQCPRNASPRPSNANALGTVHVDHGEQWTDDPDLRRAASALDQVQCKPLGAVGVDFASCPWAEQRKPVIRRFAPAPPGVYRGGRRRTAPLLGSVFLALTGGEALYADMGHFGRRAIRIDWFACVLPALMLNYFGQGALVLTDPDTAANPFFLLFSSWLLAPAVGLATAATVIATQAVISGAFALVQQAIQLGAVPRLEVRQTSQHTAGQVYVPQINWLLAIAVLALVMGFRSSDALANAYGIAVAGDMFVTSILVAAVARWVWGWSWALLLPIAGLFFALDTTFVAANVHKIAVGGWFPLLVGVIVLTLTLCWRRGRLVALARRDADAVPLAAFIASLHKPDSQMRVPGTAVYLTTQRNVVPAALALNLKHNSVLHDRVVLLKVSTSRTPRVAGGADIWICREAGCSQRAGRPCRPGWLSPRLRPPWPVLR